MGMFISGDGIKLADVNELKQFGAPDRTESYVPISHFDLAMNLMQGAQDILVPKGYELVGSDFGVAKEGSRFFGLLKYANADSEHRAMAIAFRNSYDRSMSVGFAIGDCCFICNNLALNGKIVRLMKHTKGVEQRLIDGVRLGLFDAVGQYVQFLEMMAGWRAIPLSEDFGFRFLGSLAGSEVLMPDPHSKAMQYWRKPEHPEFGDRNAENLFNACTWALKGLALNRIIPVQLGLTAAFQKEFSGRKVIDVESDDLPS